MLSDAIVSFYFVPIFLCSGFDDTNGEAYKRVGDAKVF